MKTKTISFSLAIILPVLLILLRCGSDKIAGNGSQTPNSNVAAILYNPGGSPAAYATVRFYKSGSDPRDNPGDSTITDAHGNYVVKLDTGTYNILAHGDSGMAFRDSIKVIKGDTAKPSADTLKAPGSIKGIVQLQTGDDARTVFILFLGTHTFTMPSDDTGHFATDNMAAGKYSVRILTTIPNYKVLDTSLSVAAGKIDTLTHDIVLQYTGIPVPSGLKIKYDTLKQIVTLSWNKPITGRAVRGYNIYRKEIDSTTFVNVKNGILDTVYQDSTGVQDLTYEYRIAAVDTNTAEGLKSAAVNITILSCLQFIRRIGTSGTGIGQYVVPIGVSLMSNNDLLVLDYTRGAVIRYDTLGNFKDEFKGFNRPTGIASLTSSSFLVGEADSSTIHLIDSTGAQLFQIGGIGVAPGKFGQAVAIWDFAVSPTGTICVPDEKNNRLEMFDSQGLFLKSISIEQPFSVCFVNDSILAVGTVGTIWGISVIDTSGLVLSTWPTYAVSSPCTTPNGNIAVVDYGISKIRFFSLHGEFLAVGGTVGKDDLEFTDLRAIVPSKIAGILFALDEIGSTVKMLAYPPKL